MGKLEACWIWKKFDGVYVKESSRVEQEDYISYRLWLKKAERVRTVIGGDRRWMGRRMTEEQCQLVCL